MIVYLLTHSQVGIGTTDPQAPLHIIGDPNLVSPPENAAYVWTTRTTINNNWTDITWADDLGLFVAVSDSGTGINWTTQASAVNNNWISVTWAKELGLLVAVASTGSGDRVMTSPDGINWTTQASAANNDWRYVTWAKEIGLLVAVARTGAGNRIMTSPDGINWAIQSSPADNEWYFVAWAPELGILCAVSASGTNNRVMTSSLYLFDDQDRVVMNLGGSILRQPLRKAPLYSSRTYVNFNGLSTIPEIRENMNITSIERLGVGNYRLNFTYPLPNDIFSIVATSGTGGTGRANQAISTGTKTTTSARIFNADLFLNASIDSADINVIITI
jgi:hypothetical protein